MPGTRKLGRPTAHRMAMLRGMVTLLLENGSIQTTVTRAKEVRSLTDNYARQEEYACFPPCCARLYYKGRRCQKAF